VEGETERVVVEEGEGSVVEEEEKGVAGGVIHISVRDINSAVTLRQRYQLCSVAIEWLTAVLR